MRIHRSVVSGVLCIGILAGCESFSSNRRTTSRDPNAQTAKGSASAATQKPGAHEQHIVTDPTSLQKAAFAVAKGGPAAGKRADQLEAVALFYGKPLPTTFSIANDGRIFVAFPRWSDPTDYTVAEIKEGNLIPFPSPELNRFYPENPAQADPATRLVSVQSVVCDSANRLWMLDTGSINMAPPIPGATKIWAYDLTNGQRVKQFPLSSDVVKPKTYINDARFDLSRGKAGYAFVTDSGEGGIIVIDIATGEAWRRLDGNPAVKATSNFVPNVEGEPLMKQPEPQSKPKPMDVGSDGIAISPDGETLYFTPLASRSLYAVSVDALIDRKQSNEQVARTLKKIAEKPSGNDGLIADSNGRIYTTEYEDNSIKRYDLSTGEGSIIVQDERILWPDCVWLHDGFVYFTSNQLNRQPGYHRGKDLRQNPYVLFRMPVDAQPIGSRRVAKPATRSPELPNQDSGVKPNGTRPDDVPQGGTAK